MAVYTTFFAAQPSDLADAFPLVDWAQRLVHVRRVRGLNLWLWYFEAGDVLELATLTDQPPGA